MLLLIPSPLPLDIETINFDVTQILYLYLELGCFFVTVRSPSHVVDTIGKLSMRRGAWALFCSVSTHDVKVIEFRSFYDFKKLENYFYFD